MTKGTGAGMETAAACSSRGCCLCVTVYLLKSGWKPRSSITSSSSFSAMAVDTNYSWMQWYGQKSNNGTLGMNKLTLVVNFVEIVIVGSSYYGMENNRVFLRRDWSAKQGLSVS